MARVTRRQILAGSAGAAAGYTVRQSSAAGPSLSDFHMPLESEPHQRTFMQWPISVDVYSAPLLKRVQGGIVEIARAISRFEDVVVLAGPAHMDDAKSKLGMGIDVWDVPPDDLWCRDSGPTFVRNAQGELAVSLIQFNGRGVVCSGFGDSAADGKAREILEQLYPGRDIVMLNTDPIGESGGGIHCSTQQQPA